MNIPNSSFILTYAQNLIKTALQHEQWMVRFCAAEVLADTKNPECLPNLLQALRHQNAFIRDRATKALGNFGTEEVIASLQKMLTDLDVETRAHALISLTKAIVLAISDGLKRKNSDNPEPTKSATDNALPIQSATDNALPMQSVADNALPYDQIILAAIDQGFQDNNGLVQEFAFHSAKLIGEKSHTLLCTMLKDHIKIMYPVKLKIATYLVEMNEPTGRTFLYGALESHDRWIAFLSATCLAKLHDPKGLPQLQEELSQSGWEEKIKALEALLDLGIQNTAIQTLYSPKDKSIPDMTRLEVLRVLNRLQPEQTCQQLQEMFTKGNDNIKTRIIEIMAELKKPELLDMVQPIIDNGPEHLRAEVIMAVEKLGTQESALRLWPILDHSHWLVRLQTARVILKLLSM